MTHPEGEVGGANDEPIVAAEPTLEDRFAAISQEPEEQKVEEEVPQGAEAEPELTPEDVTEEEEAGGDPEPIQPPVSWKEDEKEEFRQLPRALQETLSRREAEREKFVQSKAQEAVRAKTEAEKSALSSLTELQKAYAAELGQYASMFQGISPPDPELNLTDPVGYAQQFSAYQNAIAQQQQLQQRSEDARLHAQRLEHEIQARAAEEFKGILAEKLPVFFDPTEGPKLREQLGSIAADLGYSAEQAAQADALDVIAMHKASQWKAKADKYDTLMAKKMERVREARGMPKVSRPGTAQPKGAMENQRYSADRDAMRKGDRDAGARVFSRFL